MDLDTLPKRWFMSEIGREQPLPPTRSSGQCKNPGTLYKQPLKDCNGSSTDVQLGMPPGFNPRDDEGQQPARSGRSRSYPWQTTEKFPDTRLQVVATGSYRPRSGPTTAQQTEK